MPNDPEPCPSDADLAAFCWGEGAAPQRAALVAHLSSCRACRTRAARIVSECRDDTRPDRDDTAGD